MTNMTLVDANTILRIILNDNEKMVNETKSFIAGNAVLIKNEVMAEIVYVLTKLYKVDRKTTCQCIRAIIETENINVDSTEIIAYALDAFAESNLDFVDCLLCGYNHIRHNDIFTFDKKINSRLKRG